jgi:hypothetical protein
VCVCVRFSRRNCNCQGFIVPKSKREGRQDRRKPAVPRTNIIEPATVAVIGNRIEGPQRLEFLELCNLQANISVVVTVIITP